ncbi:unnamed protein product [Ilex paraguariensis]|uniref:RING-type domain-containing protein n=1 Tax=Ilex paraguariensis TaxID=185542 RepID=A0ABC8TV38_9AQUA
MAVQAQYPSNVLLLNRSAKEGKSSIGNDYSLQLQPGGGERGGFFDQSHMLFNNGVLGTNLSRKRGRELTTTETINTLVSMQPQASQLIDRTQLHTPPPNIVSTGLQLAFGDQQRQQQQPQHQHQHHHRHQQQQQQQPQQSLSSQSSVLKSLLSEELATQIKQQRDEIEHFLQTQGEQMRRTLAEKRQSHYRALLGAAEESVAKRLREKEAEVEKATRRNADLQAWAAQLSAEAQVWQARARAEEATAARLQAQLQQAIMSGGCAQQQDREEGGGGMGCAVGETEDAESAYIDPDRAVVCSGPSCKACGKRVASVVLLPCRHLCVCTGCDAVVQGCPVCFSFRSSSVEVFFC